MKRSNPLVLIVSFAVCALGPSAARAQSEPGGVQTAPAAAGSSRLWLSVGATSVTLRGDCQEDCPGHGTGAYLHTGAMLTNVGYRVTPQMDAGLEVYFVPAKSKAGEQIRSTFILSAAQYRPWESHGFLLKVGMGMVFVKNFVYAPIGELPPITSKALGLTYGAGWAFRRAERVGVDIFASQHVAALGDFQSAGTVLENVMANFWSVGAVLRIR